MPECCHKLSDKIKLRLQISKILLL